MTSPSSSEGEISDLDKANLTEHTLHNGSVDRKSRDRVSATQSPIAQFDGVNDRLRSWSRSPYRSNRSRSRSPYRSRKSGSPRERSPRGAKRRRQSPDSRRTGGRFDTRNQRGRYRDSRNDRNYYRDQRRGRDFPPHRNNRVDRDTRAPYQRSHVSYADIDRSDEPNTQRNERRRADRDYRAQEHSPNPYYRRNAYRDERRGPYSERVHDERGTHGELGSSRRLEERLYDQRPEFKGSGRGFDQGGVGIPQQNDNLTNIPTNSPTKKMEDQKTSVRFGESGKIIDTHMREPKGDEFFAIPTAVVPAEDEDLLIEERRKRREAIKARYKTHEPSRIHQALQNHEAQDSPPRSPNVDLLTERSERSVSPIFSTPTTPGPDTAAESPMHLDVESDMDLAHRPHQADTSAHQDASAADYDASMDMQEDHAKFKNNRRAAAEDETANLKLDSAANVEVQQQKKPGKEPDMFAEDDDDMFASVSPEQTRASAVPQVQKAVALDRGLLDDWDDHQGYYKIILGELLDNRYHVKEQLGKGVFSGVVRALDIKTDRAVAIKIIRNNETMRKAGLKEIIILEKLKENDVEDKRHIVKFERHFDHKDHLCMVFESLSINLREVLKKFGRDIGINIQAVRTYAHQMFLALGLLKKCNILHADLKPDNILVNDKRNVLKICDLGSAAESDENEITPYLVSRFYRAPEIILGMKYDYGIDMWSVGCTLFELYTGKILFTGRSNNQMLRTIQETRGKLTLKLLKKCEFAGLHFDDDGSFRSTEKDISGRDVVRVLTFSKLLEGRDLKSRLLAVANTQDAAELKEVNLFADLLDRCLALNPEKRITPSQALQHPFIQRSKPRQLMAPSIRRPVNVKGRT